MPARFEDAERPVCPLCGVSTNILRWNSKHEREYRCPICLKGGTAEKFAKSQIVVDEEQCLPLPAKLIKSEIDCSKRQCEKCKLLEQCRADVRAGKPAQGESVGIVIIGETVCIV